MHIIDFYFSQAVKGMFSDIFESILGIGEVKEKDPDDGLYVIYTCK